MIAGELGVYTVPFVNMIAGELPGEPSVRRLLTVPESFEEGSGFRLVERSSNSFYYIGLFIPYLLMPHNNNTRGELCLAERFAERSQERSRKRLSQYPSAIRRTF